MGSPKPPMPLSHQRDRDGPLSHITERDSLLHHGSHRGRQDCDLQTDPLGLLGWVQSPCPRSISQALFQTPAPLKVLMGPACIPGSLGAATKVREGEEEKECVLVWSPLVGSKNVMET